MIPDKEHFAPLFVSIVEQDIREAVQSTDEPGDWSPKAISFASDRIWFPVRERGFVFNTRKLWSLPGFECWQETPAKLPADFPMDWRVSTVCWAEHEARSKTVFTQAKLVRIDPSSGEVSFTNAAGARTACRIDRVSHKDLGRFPMSMDVCAPNSEGLTISLDCRECKEPVASWMVYGDGGIDLLSSNNVVVRLQPSSPKTLQ
ncbi:MAG TPA: hypothetical protein VHB79_33460 [Polyangiaceae bacterium]|nr:hypothetical protein [Polyangiaceae bacterium]